MHQIVAIERGTLELILGASRSSHPLEFAGVLREENGVVREVLLLPGTFSSDRSAVLSLHMLPIDPTACGTVHSHPSPSASPSQEDLRLFSKFGRVHIIAASPYNEESWRAYDHRGSGIELKVLE